MTAELPILVFDVNETLLDLETLTPHFASIFGGGQVMREWFAQLIIHLLRVGTREHK
jgi:2-haloacid dehalogenase